MKTTANICTLCDEMCHRIYAVCNDMRRRVRHVTARLTTWNVGEVTVGVGDIDTIAWMRITHDYGITVFNEEGLWISWHSASLQLQLDTFARLPELVNLIVTNLAETLEGAEVCELACKGLDTLLGTPAPASGGEGA